MKKIRIPIFILLIALIAALFAPSALALDEPELDVRAAVLLAERGDSETVLLTKNEHERVYPASLTKVMTVLLAVEAVESGTVSLADAVTAQPGFDFDMIEGGTSVYLGLGETMTLENLLYCAMIASANECCNVIGQYIDGSVDAFVQHMNTRAAELGCTETNFTNTHGLPDANHYTTAWDFSRILRAAVSHDLFMQICSAIEYTVPATNVSGERKLSNTNSLINPTNPMYPGDYGYQYARGVKTGHTNDAGYCLASSAEKDDITLVSVVMGGQALTLEDGSTWYTHFGDTITLFDWAFDNFSYQEVLKSTEIVADIPIAMGADTDTIAARPSVSISALLPNDVDLSTITRDIVIYSENTGEILEAPISAGQIVGEISVSLGDRSFGSTSLVTSTSVDLSRAQYMKSQLKDTLSRPAVIITFWALVLLLLVYILLVIRYRARRRAYQKRLENARRIRLDLEEEEDEVRYERRVRASAEAHAPRQSEIAMAPESYTAKSPDAEDEDVIPEETVDEPTRVRPVRRDAAPEDEQPTRVTPLDPEPLTPEDLGDEAEFKDYFDQFFGKK